MPAGGKAFTLLTTEPGPDVEPIQNRQMVVLNRSEWSVWLEQTGNEAELLRPLLAGSFAVEQVRYNVSPKQFHRSAIHPALPW